MWTGLSSLLLFFSVHCFCSTQIWWMMVPWFSHKNASTIRKENTAAVSQEQNWRMHRIFGQNQVTFELGCACLLNGKVYSNDTPIHSYINHLTIQLSNISWIYITPTEQLALKNHHYKYRVHQIFGQRVSNIRT